MSQQLPVQTFDSQNFAMAEVQAETMTDGESPREGQQFIFGTLCHDKTVNIHPVIVLLCAGKVEVLYERAQ